jgi:hypothetical protein
MRLMANSAGFMFVLLVVASSSSYAQTIRSNEPIEARIAKSKEVHHWKIEVGDNEPIEFEVDCKTGSLYATLTRVKDNVQIDLQPIQGTNASHFNGGRKVLKASNAAVPRIGPFSGNNAVALDRGLYRLEIGGVSKDDIGRYELVVRSPVFKKPMLAAAPANQPPAPPIAGIPAPQPKSDVEVLQQILQELKELRTRVERLEKP